MSSTGGTSMKRLRIIIITLFIATVGLLCWKIIDIFEYSGDTDDLQFLDDYRDYQKTSKHATPLRVVHLDLKGAPPKMIYIKEILPLIVASGGNALLIEYEDTFPYEGVIKNISNTNPYSMKQVNVNTENVATFGLLWTPNTDQLQFKIPQFAPAATVTKRQILSQIAQIFDPLGLIVPITVVSKRFMQSLWETKIKELLQLCEYYGIEVIPLVQTFGHMEHVLKVAEFQELREQSTNPSEICPSNPNSLTVIREMIRQVMKMHPMAKRLHIGCDEVFHINKCKKCLQRNLESSELFVQHVKEVASFVKSEFPNVTPLIWDDMMRSWAPGYLATTDLNKFVEPVVWVYSTDILAEVPHRVWYWYFNHFSRIWVASAYKGATSAMSILPNVAKHYENQKSWLTFISKNLQSSNTQLVGYILTGWSRYDHFASLCELLPVATPSLILNLLIVSSAFTQHFNVVSSYDEILKCRRVHNTLHSILQMKTTQSCVFPAQHLIPLTFQLMYYYSKVNSLYPKLYEENAWMSNHLVRSHETNVWKIREQFDRLKVHEIYNSFLKLREELRFEMSKYYSDSVVAEWMQDHLDLYLDKIELLNDNFEKSSRQISWQRRNGS